MKAGLKAPDPVARGTLALQLLVYSGWYTPEPFYRELLKRPDLPEALRVQVQSIVENHEWQQQKLKEMSDRKREEEQRQREEQMHGWRGI